VLVNWQPRHQQDEESASEDASTGGANTEPNTRHMSPSKRCGSSSRSMESNMPDCGFGRCDGHHKMIDFRLKKQRLGLASPAAVSNLPINNLMHLNRRGDPLD